MRLPSVVSVAVVRSSRQCQTALLPVTSDGVIGCAGAPDLFSCMPVASGRTRTDGATSSGCKEAVAKHPDIKIVSIQNGKQERDQALTVTENMLQAQPTLKGIFSVNDNGSLGALSAIEASGMDVKLVSVDGAPEAIKAIQKPGSHFIATSAQYPRDQIRLALGIALAKKWGAQVPASVPVDITLIDQAKAKDFSW